MIDWLFISAAQAAPAQEGHGHGAGGHSPLEQFNIERYLPLKLFGIDMLVDRITHSLILDMHHQEFAEHVT